MVDLSNPVSQFAVLKKNLSAVFQIWKEYVKYYSVSIFALREFIWSFRRLGDLTSAFKVLQLMVSLANKGDIHIGSRYDEKFFTKQKRRSDVNEKLHSIRLDIPIPLKTGPGSITLDMKENIQVDSFICPPFEHSSDVDSTSIEAKSVGMCQLNVKKYPAQIMRVLRWSFSHVIHGYAHALNYYRAQQLILQVGMLITFVIVCAE